MDLRGNFFGQVTPIVLTYNEAPNIGRCLERLTAFKEVLIVDSGSTDETLVIAARFSNTRILNRPFDSFSGQWNYALRAGEVTTEWVLAMDADYILTDEFLIEISQLVPSADTVAFRVAFEYWVLGRRLSGTLYPPLIALYRRDRTHYIQDGHCMRAQVDGRVATVTGRIRHDDRKPLLRWLTSQLTYSAQESELLMRKPASELSLQDRVRRMIVIAPWLVPLYCLTAGRGLLDGRAGIYYALQRGIAESLLSLQLIAARIRRGGR